MPAAGGDLPLHEFDEFADAVGLVHDEVARLQLQRVDDVLAPTRELLDHARIVADRAAIKVRFGEHRETGLGRFEPCLDLAHDQVHDPGFGRRIQRVDDACPDPALGEHVAGPLQQADPGRGDDHGPALGDALPDVRGRAVDIAVEGGDGAARDPHVRVVGELAGERI